MLRLFGITALLAMVGRLAEVVIVSVYGIPVYLRFSIVGFGELFGTLIRLLGFRHHLRPAYLRYTAQVWRSQPWPGGRHNCHPRFYRASYTRRDKILPAPEPRLASTGLSVSSGGGHQMCGAANFEALIR
jgi:hypothetical protein